VALLVLRPSSRPAPGDVAGVVPLEAITRTPADATWLAVLTDGRITGVVERTLCR
jgi:hypothetical protein